MGVGAQRARRTVHRVVVVWRSPSLVARRKLFRTLSEEADRRVTLVAAPAGSGKTVLLRTWVEHARIGDGVAWVTLEPGEVDAQHFWIRVVDALRGAVGAATSLTELEPTLAFDGDAAAERIALELCALEHEIVLVLDDLHELDSEDALRQLQILLDRRPPRLHLVIASRSEPRLGLHRLRLDGELTEIRSDDLRFTLAETRELLADSGVTLSEESIARLHERTEGWAAGIRLAALALTEHENPEEFIAEFSGSEHSVADYLLNEVLERQPEEARLLLVRTSILERVNGALADLLTGSTGSVRILYDLERENAFLSAVDVGRNWFRCHQLFRDLLRLELERLDPDGVPDLHRRAAAWLEADGDVVAAVRHLQAAQDWPAAIRLVADSGFSLALDGRAATLDALLGGFPGRIVLSQPELSPLLAMRQATAGSASKADGYISLAERSASTVPEDRRTRFEILLGLARLVLARRRGDFEYALSEAGSMLTADALVAEVALGDDVHTAALMNIGVAELWSNRTEAAEHHLELALTHARLAGRAQLEVFCLAHLAVLAEPRSFATARELGTEAVAIADARGWGADRIAGVALVVLGDLDVWQGRFEQAEQWLERAERAVRPELDPAAGLMLRQAQARLNLACGRDAAAAATLRDARRLAELLVSPHTMTATSLRLLMQADLRLGEIAAAEATLSELREAYPDSAVVHAAVADLDLAQDAPRAALDALEPLLDGSVPTLDVLSVQAHLAAALAHDRLGERPAVETELERAFDLAEPEGLMWPFVAAPVRALIEQHPRHRSAHGAFLREILALPAGVARDPRAVAADPRLDALTDAELRVLRYLSSNLSATEIAKELSLSIHTVRTHTRRVYAKLAVQRRTDAVERARRLGLL